jgi:tetratricopeptide (TPR) repeat protein
MPLRRIADELADAGRRLDALDAGDEVTQVRAVFSWSYRALSPDAARLFRLIGLHPGPEISVPAAASLSASTDQHTRVHLHELTRAHLLAEPAPGRYTCHDLLHAYARELADEPDEARRRMIDHYLHTAFEAALLFHPGRPGWFALAPHGDGVRPEPLAGSEDAVAWLERERAVVLDLISLTADLGFGEQTWQLTWAMSNYLQFQGHWQAWITAMETAVAAVERIGDRHNLARVRNGLALAYMHFGRRAEARACLLESLATFEEVGDVPATATTCRHLGALHEMAGEFDEGLAYCYRALSLQRTNHNETGEAGMRALIGWLLCRAGRYEEGLAESQLALALHQASGDPVGQASTWDSIGYARHHLGQPAAAVACFEESLSFYRQSGIRYAEAEVLEHLGDAHDAASDPDAARRAWQAAFDILDELDRPEAGHLRAKLDHS